MKITYDGDIYLRGDKPSKNDVILQVAECRTVGFPMEPGFTFWKDEDGASYYVRTVRRSEVAPDHPIQWTGCYGHDARSGLLFRLFTNNQTGKCFLTGHSYADAVMYFGEFDSEDEAKAFAQSQDPYDLLTIQEQKS